MMAEAYPRREPSNIACVMQGPMVERIVELIERLDEVKRRMREELHKKL